MSSPRIYYTAITVQLDDYLFFIFCVSCCVYIYIVCNVRSPIIDTK